MQGSLKNESSETVSTKKEIYDNERDLSYICQSCRSINDITSFFNEFSFNENDGNVICRYVFLM